MASDKLWNRIDVHPEFGIGRPYLGKDPAHVGPIDGKEYADHRKSNVAKRLLAKVSNTLPNFRTVTSGGTTAAELKSTSARYLSLSLHETEAVGALSRALPLASPLRRWLARGFAVAFSRA
jgi:hypothetical protein